MYLFEALGQPVQYVWLKGMIFLACVTGMTGSSAIQMSMAWTNNSSILGSPSGSVPIWSTSLPYSSAAGPDQRQAS